MWHQTTCAASAAEPFSSTTNEYAQYSFFPAAAGYKLFQHFCHNMHGHGQPGTIWGSPTFMFSSCPLGYVE